MQMYQQNPGQQQANPQGQQPQQQQYGGNMNRMPMSGATGGQNMPPGGCQMMPNQGAQGGMRPMGSMGMRPQNMSPQQQGQQQQQMMQQQQQQQQIIMQQQQTQAQPPMVQQPQAPPTQQQPSPSPQQPMSNQSQNPLTPMGYGEGGPTPNSPSVAPQTPGNSAPDQQQQQQQPATPNPNTPQQPPQQQKEINTAMVCRIGQETVQEIISRTHEVFSYLRVLQPPYGSAVADKNFHEKQIRLQEVLGGITTHFKRLRVCWEKANEHTAGMEYTALESLIPYKDDQTMKNEIDKKRGEPYKSALEEHNELIQQLVLKNKHIKEIIDQMRNIIWEINTMLAMR